ncbi:2-hydroxyacid dehydrogenase [Duganella sp. FT80W]|uniref:2-hydroxyacid dehydrogenase n=1 Tax=Duganella guangzhouensis TaxID=2666084 RepID=A0A6I2L5R4_9BURK|nr:2-hydroxyacid dehydrogenase [Duganella guangzhouensis]MRW93491.1 2-hydroxyacid dehydrogenase [Duganella guangzhouensis]
MPPAVLLISPVLPELDRQLAERYTVHRLYQHADQNAYLNQHQHSIVAVVTGGALGISTALMERLPALKIVTINGIGTDAVDLGYARRHGIHVTTTPDVLTADVADLGIGLAIATLRGLCTGDRYVRAGDWGSKPLALANKFSGKRVGIVGFGRVGRAIAQRAAAFDCPISYVDRREHADVPYRYVSDLLQLARDSDVLVLAASANDGKVIVTSEVLDALGPQGVLINIARGKLVDEQALVLALQEKRLGGAGLDVFVDEPRVPAALWTMENVVLQPHRASATEETRRDMGQIVLDNLAAYFAGQRPPTSVTI